MQHKVHLQAQATVRARVSGAFYRRLRIAAIKNGMTVTDVVKAALHQWLEANAPDETTRL